MTKVYGIGIETKLIQDAQDVLWEDTLCEKSIAGIKLAIRIGKVLRPVKKFWKRGNPWKGENVWFVMRIPVFVCPFISVAIGNRGAYIGAKIYGCDLDYYKTWCRDEEWGKNKYYLCPSLSIRRTRLV